MEEGLVIIYVFAILAVAFSIMALLPNALTSFATSSTVGSNVTVEDFFAIDLSANLSNGISFDEITSLPATNINSTDNYNGDSSGSTMLINVSTDSNSNVDFCIKANAGLTDSSNSEVIGLGNESYANSSSTSSTAPAIGEESALTTSYVKSSAPNIPGGNTYYRFWLDVPSTVSSGSYNNTINFKGIKSLTSC